MSDAQERKVSAALGSIVASAAITIGKLVAGLMSGSLALLSEAGHAAVDTGATVLTWLAVRAAGKPADDDHHYGHAKYEALAALIETGLLFGLTAFIVIEAVHRLMAGGIAIEPTPIAFIVLILSIIIDAVRWRSLSKIAAETKSDALAADAMHFSSDLVASVLVLGGLIASAYGFKQADSFAAFGVAIFVAVAGFRLGKRTIDALLDAAPKGETARLRAIVTSVPGVADIAFLRLRPAGSQLFGEIGIGVSRTLSIERVQRIADNVLAAIKRDAPEASLTLTTIPVALDTETVRDSVLLIAARQRAAIHHLIVQDINGRRSVSFDIEVTGDLPYGEAHDIASRLEAAIGDELGDDVEVESHVEPLETRELSGTDLSQQALHDLTQRLERYAREGGLVKNIHDVRARATEVGLVVNYHCYVDPAISVKDVHQAVDRVDRLFRSEEKNIFRIVGHADPSGQTGVS